MQLSEFDLDKHEGERISSPGKCIYCRASGVRLNDEHAIPYAIGANTLILEKSCCETCQAIIQPYEQEVLRKQLGIFRAQVDAPTRNKKDRAKIVQLRFFEVNDQAEAIRDLGYRSIPIADAPVIINLWSSPPARLFRTDDSPVDVGRPWSHYDNGEIQSLCRTVAKETGSKHVAVKIGEVNRVHYLRSLAKTAHACAVAKFGLDAFEPVLPDLILKRSDDVSLYVGDASADDPVPADPTHSFQVVLGEAEDGPAKGYLFAWIRLYPLLGSPAHMVVVGRALEDISERFRSQAL